MGNSQLQSTILATDNNDRDRSNWLDVTLYRTVPLECHLHKANVCYKFVYDRMGIEHGTSDTRGYFTHTLSGCLSLFGLSAYRSEFFSVKFLFVVNSMTVYYLWSDTVSPSSFYRNTKKEISHAVMWGSAARRRISMPMIDQRVAYGMHSH